MDQVEARVKSSYYVRVAVVGVLTLGVGALLMLLSQRRWARAFDRAGVTRRDGRQLFWNDLREIKFVHLRHGLGPLNHVELVFGGGKAFVFPLMIENRDEVMSLINSFPGAPPSTSRRET